MDNLPLWGLALVMLGGIAGHIIKEVWEIRQTTADRNFHLWHYLAAYPYQTLVMVFGAAAAFLGLYETETLNTASAFLAGWAVNSAAGAAPGERTQKLA